MAYSGVGIGSLREGMAPLPSPAAPFCETRDYSATTTTPGSRIDATLDAACLEIKHWRASRGSCLSECTYRLPDLRFLSSWKVDHGPFYGLNSEAALPRPRPAPFGGAEGKVFVACGCVNARPNPGFRCGQKRTSGCASSMLSECLISPRGKSEPGAFDFLGLIDHWEIRA